MTFSIPVSLNAEACFVVAGILVVFVRAKRRSPLEPAWTANRLDALAIASVVATVLGFFAWTAHSYFLADDFTLLSQAHAPVSWRAVFATRGGDGSYRPIGYLSYVISSKWAGSDPAAWHWIGYLMHIANAALVYALAATLGYSRFAAWLAATIFALHGAHPEAVVWMAGRFDLLSTLFFLVAALAFVRSWGAGGRRILYQAVALISMTAALLSKESAYSFAPVALLLVACFGSPKKRAWGPLVCFVLVTAILFVYRWNLLGGIGGYGGISLLPSLKALALRMWAIQFFPVNWTIPPERPLRILAIVYVAALARLFAVRAELQRLWFAVGFMILTAAPAVSQLLIGTDLEKSRVLYLPSIGFCLLLAVLCEPIGGRQQAALAAGLILFHGTLLWHNLRGWQKASEVVESACMTAAKCAEGGQGTILVTGLTRTLDGVYTFANGFAECVAMQSPGRRVEVRLNATATGEGDSACKLAWDGATNTLRVVH